jgi:hypothetical protein
MASTQQAVATVSNRRMDAGWVPVRLASNAFDTPALLRTSSSERTNASTESIPARASV